MLFVGTVEPRKNLPMLVRAFDRLAVDHPDVVLVVAGPDGWGVEAYDEAVRAATHSDRIHRIGYVDGADKADLLGGASVLAYASVYEGFGHPPLEAMQVGVPVVAADAGALPEVLGDAALLPDPTDADNVAGALTRALDDDELRDTLIRRGYERAARYRWDEAARAFTSEYERLAGG